MPFRRTQRSTIGNNQEYGYLVRRAASTGEVTSASARKTDIIAVPTSRENSVGPSPRPKKSDAKEGEKQSYYTDRYFSSNFLSDSIPLSEMLKGN